jgi:hypothetical protein
MDISEEPITMLHKSELGEHADRFPQDSDGHVPEHGDHWSDMSFEHGPHDPDEPGISAEERAKRMEYLDSQWWPSLLEKVGKQRDELAQLPGGSPIKRWREEAMREPPSQHGYNAEGYSPDSTL